LFSYFIIVFDADPDSMMINSQLSLRFYVVSFDYLDTRRSIDVVSVVDYHPDNDVLVVDFPYYHDHVVHQNDCDYPNDYRLFDYFVVVDGCFDPMILGVYEENFALMNSNVAVAAEVVVAAAVEEDYYPIVVPIVILVPRLSDYCRIDVAGAYSAHHAFAVDYNYFLVRRVVTVHGYDHYYCFG
jgi:hypothetical protein